MFEGQEKVGIPAADQFQPAVLYPTLDNGILHFTADLFLFRLVMMVE